MSGTQRYSSGTDRSRDSEYAQSFASLSLSDYDSHAPRGDYYDPSYPDAYGSPHEPTYAGNDQYSLTAPSSYAPTPSPSAAYGSAGAYGSSYPTTSATSSAGGYEYQGEPSGTSSYGDYATYDTASVASSSMPSSHGGGGSASGWSDSQSRGTAPSTAPSSRQSRRTDVNNTIHRQPPPAQRYQLPCEFHNLTGCNRVFTGDDTQAWMEHVEGHLRSNFPSKLRCWFCSDYYFDASQTSGGDARSNFIMRMQHIRDHLVFDGSRLEQSQKDGHVVQHLLDHNLIDRRTYDSIVNPTSVPPVPGTQGHHSSHSSHSSHRGHRSHHGRLPQVEEDVAGESSNSRHHRRSEHHRPDHHRSGHKKDHNRDRDSSRKHRSK